MDPWSQTIPQWAAVNNAGYTSQHLNISSPGDEPVCFGSVSLPVIAHTQIINVRV